MKKFFNILCCILLLTQVTEAGIGTFFKSLPKAIILSETIEPVSKITAEIEYVEKNVVEQPTLEVRIIENKKNVDIRDLIYQGKGRELSDFGKKTNIKFLNAKTNKPIKDGIYREGDEPLIYYSFFRNHKIYKTVKVRKNKKNNDIDIYYQQNVEKHKKLFNKSLNEERYFNVEREYKKDGDNLYKTAESYFGIPNEKDAVSTTMPEGFWEVIATYKNGKVEKVIFLDLNGKEIK